MNKFLKVKNILYYHDFNIELLERYMRRYPLTVYSFIGYTYLLIGAIMVLGGMLIDKIYEIKYKLGEIYYLYKFFKSKKILKDAGFKFKFEYLYYKNSATYKIFLMDSVNIYIYKNDRGLIIIPTNSKELKDYIETEFKIELRKSRIKKLL